MSFYLEAADGMPLPEYQPGQHLMFKLNLPGSEIPMFRYYSFSEACQPGYYRISVKREPAPTGVAGVQPGRCSCFLHDNVQEGDIVEAKGPSGSFVLDGGNDPVVLIAGGIGITPLLSMLKSLPLLQPGRQAFLYYGVNGKEEHSFREELQTLIKAYPALQVCTFYGTVGCDDRQGCDYNFEGLISARQILQHTGRTDIVHYICGPAPMMRAIKTELALLGVPEEKIFSESFVSQAIPEDVTGMSLQNGVQTQPADDRPAAGEGGAGMFPQTNVPAQQDNMPGTATAWTIRFANSDRALDWDGRFRSLLEFAEANDIEISSGCLFGDCGTCMTGLTAGEVTYTHPTMVEPDEGTCLPCSCIPASDIVLEA